MGLEDLHRTERPAEALRLDGGEVRRREPATEDVIDIAGFVAELDQAQAEFGILADAPFRPAADFLQCPAADERHRAVLDQGVALVAVVHADAEEPFELPVAHALEEAVLEVAVRLRGLHHGHLGAVEEVRHEAGEPVGFDDVVGIDHADDLGTRIRLLEGEIERPGLEPGPLRQVEEAKPRPERGAVRFHRLP